MVWLFIACVVGVVVLIAIVELANRGASGRPQGHA